MLFEVVVIFHHSCLPTGDKFQSAEGLTGWGSIVKWSLLQAAFSSRMTTLAWVRSCQGAEMSRGWKPWAEKLMCAVGASFGASVQTFLVPLSRVFIWLLARDLKRECPEGSTWGDPVAMSHLEPCYMLPCPNNSFVGRKVAFVGSQLSLPFYLH